jgi:hypothetical protein
VRFRNELFGREIWGSFFWHRRWAINYYRVEYGYGYPEEVLVRDYRAELYIGNSCVGCPRSGPVDSDYPKREVAQKLCSLLVLV